MLPFLMILLVPIHEFLIQVFGMIRTCESTRITQDMDVRPYLDISSDAGERAYQALEGSMRFTPSSMSVRLTRICMTWAASPSWVRELMPWASR